MATTVPVGVVSLLEGVAEVCRPLPHSLGLGLSLGESLDSEYDRHDGGVFNVVTLLEALCLKT
jgi:hypothetical protein